MKNNRIHFDDSGYWERRAHEIERRQARAASVAAYLIVAFLAALASVAAFLTVREIIR